MTSNGRFTSQQLADIDSAVRVLETHEGEKRRLEAEQLAALARALQQVFGRGDPKKGAPDRELAYRSLRLEVATALNDSEHNAERLLSTAFLAHEHFAMSLDALRSGEISLGHLRVLTEEGSPLETGNESRDKARRLRYEGEALSFAKEETPNRLRPIARRLAAAHSEDSLEERHEAALRRRSVRVVALDDGMADLIAHLPAEDAYAIKDRIAAIAKRAIAGVGEAELSPAGMTFTSAGVFPAANSPRLDGPAPGRSGRSSDEVRADVLRDLLLGRDLDLLEEGNAGGSGSGRDANLHEWDQVRAHVQVVIPAHGVPELVGYGPIDSATAARLAAGAKAWERVTVDDAGSVLAVDRYRPSAEMTRLLVARDLHCRAPGCRVPASRCDTDHTVDAALGGATSTANLAHLCRGHHTLKHHTDWKVEQEPEGVIRWTSPTGRQYRDRPPSRVRFRRSGTDAA
ncbi:DUF222 domain-containing protein [Leucobacter sp. NPDC015123]|uniref:HNH endonuclease signature motif containing protein n=1 Tax=Leucobacter sp. NPDC015123 TaxID=3364129 RepID=UPI0036F48652